MSSFCFVLEERFVATQTLFQRVRRCAILAGKRKDRKSEIEKTIQVVKPVILKELFLKSCLLDKIFYEPSEIVLLNQKAMGCVDEGQSYQSNWSAFKKNLYLVFAVSLLLLF